MSENSEKIDLQGSKFDLVKQGLDREQVNEALKQLANKCQTLENENQEIKKREEHLTSLTRLAEKTVMEADGLAKEIKEDAQQNARKVVEKATQESNTAYSNTAAQLKETIAKLNAVMQHMEASVVKSNGHNKQNGNDQNEDQETAKTEDLLANFFAGEEIGELEKVPVYQGPSNEQQEIGLELLPPLDINTTMQIIEELEKLPEVEKVELLSRVDKPLVIVCLKKPLDILKTLSQMQQIEEVSESNEPEQIRQTYLISTRCEASSNKR